MKKVKPPSAKGEGRAEQDGNDLHRAKHQEKPKHLDQGQPQHQAQQPQHNNATLPHPRKPSRQPTPTQRTSRQPDQTPEPPQEETPEPSHRPEDEGLHVQTKSESESEPPRKELSKSQLYLLKAHSILASQQPGNYKEAVYCFEKALNIFREEKNSKQIYSTLLAIATTYLKHRDWIKSVEAHKEIAKFCQRVERPDLESLSLTAIGSILSQFGDGEDGRRFLDLALTIANRTPNQYCTKESMNIAKMSALEGLGNFEKEIADDLEKAEKYFKDGLKIAEADDHTTFKYKFQARFLNKGIGEGSGRGMEEGGRRRQMAQEK